MSNGVWFASESGGQGLWALSESTSSVPVITDITPGETDAVVTWTGTATHYRIDGGSTTALPDGTSPDTITGLTANTEYDSPGLELSGDGGSTWSDPVAFGTDNPGSGGGGIAISLAPADATHGHAADNLALTTGTVLAVADATHGHSADNLTLSLGGITLSVADALHAHAADGITLTAASTLVVADATHGHTADNVTTSTGGAQLVLADALHAHSAEGVAFTLTLTLAVADAAHVHRADIVSLLGDSVVTRDPTRLRLPRVSYRVGPLWPN